MPYIVIGSPALTKYMLKEHSNAKILSDGILLDDNFQEEDVFSHEMLRIDASSEIDYLSITSAIAKKISKDISFRICCTLHGSLQSNKSTIGYGSRDIEVNVGAALEKLGFKADLKDPKIVVNVHIIANVAYINISNKFQSDIRDDKINRAQSKIIEAFDFFKIDISTISPKTALDIGASPGGFSYILAKNNLHVDAIDSGEIDKRVLDLGVTHIKSKIENFNTNKIYGIIVNDMNISPIDSMKLLLKFLPNLAGNGICIMTIKCVDKRSYFYYMRQMSSALQLYAKNPIKFKHLPHNKTELTMCFIKK